MNHYTTHDIFSEQINLIKYMLNFLIDNINAFSAFQIIEQKELIFYQIESLVKPPLGLSEYEKKHGNN